MHRIQLYLCMKCEHACTNSAKVISFFCFFLFFFFFFCLIHKIILHNVKNIVWKYNLDICSNHIFVFLLSETLNQEKRLLTAMETGIGKPRYSHFSNLLSYWYLTVFLYVLYIELFKLFKLFLQKLCIVVW